MNKSSFAWKYGEIMVMVFFLGSFCWPKSDVRSCLSILQTRSSIALLVQSSRIFSRIKQGPERKQNEPRELVPRNLTVGLFTNQALAHLIAEGVLPLSPHGKDQTCIKPSYSHNKHSHIYAHSCSTNIQIPVGRMDNVNEQRPSSNQTLPYWPIDQPFNESLMSSLKIKETQLDDCNL